MVRGAPDPTSPGRTSAATPSAELHPEPGLTIVAGPNGAGKTNLLEAVFVAITGRSHRAGGGRTSWCATARPFARVRLDLARDAAGRLDRAIELVLPGETRLPRSASG